MIENIESIISQHDLIYEKPPRVWQDGFPIGNGHFGAMVYQPYGEGIEYKISKLDVWDRRTDAYPPKVPYSRIKNLLKDKDKLYETLASEGFDASVPDENVFPPGPRPCGALKIDFDDWGLPLVGTLFKQDQRLSLYEAKVNASYELSSKAVNIESSVSHDSNVLVIKVSDTWTHEQLEFCYNQKISLSRNIDLSLGIPITGQSGDISWIQYKFPDGFEYVMAMTIVGADVSPPKVYPDYIEQNVLLDYSKQRLHEYYIYLTVCTSMDSEHPLKAACSLLKAESAINYNSFKNEHNNWWQDFWSKSAIELENKFLEALWYFSLYQFASTSRGEIAPGLFGLWNAHNRPPWCGDYHGDINLAMTYWPIFSSNHLEIGKPFFETFERLLPIAKKQTQDLYNIDGLKYPIATLDTGFELCTNYYRMMQCSTAFYALIFWDWYRFTLDKKVLRKHIFPILEEGTKFYLALTEETENGVVIGPSWAPEQGPCPAYNVNNDLGLIKPMWEAYVEACDALQISSEILQQVKYYLENFPEYPNKDGEFLDSASCKDFIMLNHPGLLAMVAPGNDVDADSPLCEMAKKTMHSYLHRTNRKSFSDRVSSACDLTWPWLCCVGLKLRDTEFVEHVLMDIGVSEYLKPNGFFAFLGGGDFKSVEEKRKAFQRDDVSQALHAFFSLSSTYESRKYKMSMTQTNSAYLQIINEMLMQSHNGIIRIFPSVTPSIGKYCAFENLRAEGAFLVSAVRQEGRTQGVSIKSLAASQCRIKIYDIEDGDTLLLRDSDGNSVEAVQISPNCWQFDTRKNITYFWPDSEQLKSVSVRKSMSQIKFWIDKHGDYIYYGQEDTSCAKV